MGQYRARLSDWFSAIGRIRKQYAYYHGGRIPNLCAPRRYSEKIQWRKLFDCNPLFPVLTDKIAARAFIASRIGDDLLVPVLWTGGDVDHAPLETLPRPFVIKSTHRSGDVLIVDRECRSQPAELRASMRSWLSSGHTEEEIAYRHVPRKIIIEPLLTDAAGHRPLERRLFVFDGKVRIINTVRPEGTPDGRMRNVGFHDSALCPLDWYFSRPPEGLSLPQPQALAAMVRAAERIGRGIDHVRVDFFDAARTFVGEVTVYPWGGYAAIRPDGADRALGDLWTLPSPIYRAAAAIASRYRDIPYVADLPAARPVAAELANATPQSYEE